LSILLELMKYEAIELDRDAEVKLLEELSVVISEYPRGEDPFVSFPLYGLVPVNSMFLWNKRLEWRQKVLRLVTDRYKSKEDYEKLFKKPVWKDSADECGPDGRAHSVVSQQV